jgi:hypothetical protein
MSNGWRLTRTEGYLISYVSEDSLPTVETTGGGKTVVQLL